MGSYFSLYIAEIKTPYFVFNCFADDLLKLISNKFRMVCKVDGNLQLDSRDWSMYSSILKLDSFKTKKKIATYESHISQKSSSLRICHTEPRESWESRRFLSLSVGDSQRFFSTKVPIFLASLIFILLQCRCLYFP